MSLSDKELLHLPVYTKSDHFLGRIKGFEFDELEQKIIKYFVKPSGLIEGLLNQQLIIHYSQVVSITKEKMVVEDAFVEEKGGLLKKISFSKGGVALSPLKNRLEISSKKIFE